MIVVPVEIPPGALDAIVEVCVCVRVWCVVCACGCVVGVLSFVERRANKKKNERRRFFVKQQQQQKQQQNATAAATTTTTTTTTTTKQNKKTRETRNTHTHAHTKSHTQRPENHEIAIHNRNPQPL
jgi:sRNA-binding protein